jgi:hypothetical protein
VRGYGRLIVCAWVLLGLTVSASPVRDAGAASPSIGKAPGDCRGDSHFARLANIFDDGKTSGSYIGHSPLWLAGFSGPQATLQFLGPRTNFYSPGYGWGSGVLFVLARGFKQAVTLAGSGVKDRAPLWFDAVEVGAPNGLERQLVLSGKRQLAFAGGAGPKQWPTFPGDITVPRAGCYVLRASWPGGSWRVTFAAGR